MSSWRLLLAAVLALPWCASAAAGIIPVDPDHFEEAEREQSPSPRDERPRSSTPEKRPSSIQDVQRPTSTTPAVRSARDASPFGYDPAQDGKAHIFSVLDAPPPVRKASAPLLELAPNEQRETGAPSDPDADGRPPASTRDGLSLASGRNSTTNELSGGDPAWGFFVLVLTCFGLLAVVATGGAIYRKGRDDRYDDDVQANFQSRMNSAYDRRERRRTHPGEASASLRFLGLDDSATETEVLAAYRQLAWGAHPDHNGDPHAFKRLHIHFERALKHVQSPRSL